MNIEKDSSEVIPIIIYNYLKYFELDHPYSKVIIINKIKYMAKLRSKLDNDYQKNISTKLIETLNIILENNTILYLSEQSIISYVLYISNIIIGEKFNINTSINSIDKYKQVIQ
jgi:hypothetical protein